MYYKVKEVSDMVGVSVRTLHHYDQIGLLKPESVTSAGYRLYTDHDLERLQEVLFFKELGFSLKETKMMMERPNYNKKHSLISHKNLLLEKRKRLDEIIKMVERTIESIEGGTKMEKKEMFDAFDMGEFEKQRDKYVAEAKQKYGHTDAYKESQQKTSTYTKNDWTNIMGKSDEIFKKIASLMNKGPEASEVQEAVAEYRQHITEHFYHCTLEIYRGLGDLYVADPRFTANIDKYKEGLAPFLKEAIHYYCDHTNK